MTSDLSGFSSSALWLNQALNAVTHCWRVARQADTATSSLLYSWISSAYWWWVVKLEQSALSLQSGSFDGGGVVQDCRWHCWSSWQQSCHFSRLHQSLHPAAFDAVDHQTLIPWLEEDLGIIDSCRNWIISYLIGRSATVHVGTVTSTGVDVPCSVPQWSVLGPLMYAVYVSFERRTDPQLTSQDNLGKSVTECTFSTLLWQQEMLQVDWWRWYQLELNALVKSSPPMYQLSVFFTYLMSFFCCQTITVRTLKAFLLSLISKISIWHIQAYQMYLSRPWFITEMLLHLGVYENLGADTEQLSKYPHSNRICLQIYLVYCCILLQIYGNYTFSRVRWLSVSCRGIQLRHRHQ